MVFERKVDAGRDGMRLTSREKEILELLKKEPLISQEELAGRFGIARSSIAVHISNLMKKGVILGKGYVLNEEVSIVIIGACCLSASVNSAGQGYSIDLDWGGFALTASTILADNGMDVKVVTILGEDDQGTALIHLLQEKKVDTSTILRQAGRRTSRRVAIQQEQYFEEGFGQEDYERAVHLRDWVIFNCEWLVVEPFLQETIVRRAVKRDGEKLPYLCTYRFVQSPRDLPAYLSQFDLVVVGVEDAASIDFYREQILQTISGGAQTCIITDGNHIVYIQAQVEGEFPLMPNQSFLCRDRLPHLLCGLVYGISSGFPLRQVIRIAAGMAAAGESV